jgi:hypothetical protein
MHRLLGFVSLALVDPACGSHMLTCGSVRP